MTTVLDALQLAEALGVSAETVRRLTRDCAIPHYKIGGNIRYTLEQILQATAVDRHADDVAVDRFAAAMHTRMRECRLKGKAGWDDPEQCSEGHLHALLQERVDSALCRDSMVDVANYAMMLWARGEK